MLRRRVRRLGLAAAFLFILAIGSEMLLGSFLSPVSEPWPAGLYIADPTRGFSLAANFQARVTRITTFDIATNSAGYRDVEWPRDARPRVLLAGSSIVEGFGLPREQGVAAQLAERLAPGAAVVAAGVYPYGPPQVLATIRRECPRVKPAIVLYLYEYKHTRKDFLSDRAFLSGATEPSDGEPAWSFTLLAWRRMLSNHDLHPRQVLERWYGLDRLSASYLLARYASSAGNPEYDPENARAAARLVTEMRDVTVACGGVFALAVAPSPYEAYYGAREPATANLLSALEGTGVSVIDTRQGIPLGSRFRIPGLDYPNAAGAAWIAAQLSGPVRDAIKGR